MIQRSFWVRALWFVFVGWWVTPIVVNTAWLLNVTVVLLPIGIKLINLVPQCSTGCHTSPHCTGSTDNSNGHCPVSTVRGSREAIVPSPCRTRESGLHV
ncbi:Uncharacterized membrane protein, DUF307 [Halapricum desulfuricans]|uniref:Uncharacterized membrane protein, DUF307 n=1 Tax=Halapricum desulfuricans TaxID=2841257 RepID=A0A897NKY8_9EURY|nr:Uncharacterized membrane protein, DUF307 [Halapricum desulfuricans]